MEIDLELLKAQAAAMLETVEAELSQLERYIGIGYALAEIGFLVERLKSIGPWEPDDFNSELVFEISSMQTALCMAYGRLFVGGQIKLNPKDVPKHLKEYHDALLELRHRRYAHNDKHQTFEPTLEFEFNGTQMLVAERVSISIRLGVLEGIEELHDWLVTHMHERSEKLLNRVAQKTGVVWERAIPMDAL